MAIFNLTPDSFSSDGLQSPSKSSDQPILDPTTLLPKLHSLLAQQISILDIGGQSTRPHATSVPPNLELARILPTIRFIRSKPEFNNLALSIDTFHSSVAAAAVEAGANIVNDVSAGTLDADMLPTVAKLGCSVVLMHMRGTPQTMTGLTDYSLHGDVIAGVAAELRARVEAAQAAGIRRWRILLDPGIGFAKTQAQSLEILRRLGELRDWEGLKGLPWVVGASRKSFIGRITRVEKAEERGWGTAAAVSASVAGGADVVRCHDWVEMGQVVKMADAVWRA